MGELDEQGARTGGAVDLVAHRIDWVVPRVGERFERHLRVVLVEDALGGQRCERVRHVDGCRVPVGGVGASTTLERRHRAAVHGLQDPMRLADVSPRTR